MLPLEQLLAIIAASSRILIIQADNPDADSLGSALALESILLELGKNPVLYCAVDIPTYLRYMAGWDRVVKDVPKQFDASIIVDASTVTLLERLEASGELPWIASKPCIVLDHHESVEKVIPFAEVMINDHTMSSTGELIYSLANRAGWNVPLDAKEFIMSAILGDTQGLSNQLATVGTYHVMAELLEAGVNRPKLEEKRREFSKMPMEIFRYKSQLITRAEFSASKMVASVTIPQAEITKFSPLYNPAPLIQSDLLQTEDVAVAIVFKTYDDGRVTGAIRCNPAYPVGAELAASMGGGGHAFASGFKDTTGSDFNEIKHKCLATAESLLSQLKSDA